MEILLVGGNVHLDFTRAVLTSPIMEIRASVQGGNLTIITRPGVVVDASRVNLTDGDIAVSDPHAPSTPTILTIEVTGVIRSGDLRARPQRQTFQRWLLDR